MDAELNEWKSLYAQQRTATQTVSELARLRSRDQWRHGAEVAAMLIILVAAAVYLSSSSIPAMLLGVALLVFVGAAGIQQWFITRGLAQAMFAAPAEYAKELAQRNDREIRRLTPVWPLLSAMGLAVLVGLDVAFGWSGEPASVPLTMAVVTAEFGAIAVGFAWRTRELGRLALERSAISELSA